MELVRSDDHVCFCRYMEVNVLQDKISAEKGIIVDSGETYNQQIMLLH